MFEAALRLSLYPSIKPVFRSQGGTGQWESEIPQERKEMMAPGSLLQPEEVYPGNHSPLPYVIEPPPSPYTSTWLL